MKPQKNDSVRDHIFFVATTRLEKIEQLNAVAERKHYPALFLPITALGDSAHSPEEVTYSYRGNMLAKCATAAHFLNRYNKEQAVNALRALGFSDDRIEKARFYGCAEDSGIAFETKLKGNGHPGFTDMFFDNSSEGPYESDADKELIEGLRRFSTKNMEGKYLPFPGTETVRVFGAAGGVENLLRLMELAMKKAGLEVNARKKVPLDSSKWLQLRENSTIGVFPWTPGETINTPPKSLEVITTVKHETSVNVYDGSTHPTHTERSIDLVAHPRHRVFNGKWITHEELGPVFQPEARTRALIATMQALSPTVKPVRDNARWNEYITEKATSLANAGTFRHHRYKAGLVPGDGAHAQSPLREALIQRCASEGIDVGVGTEDQGDLLPPASAWKNLHDFQSLLEGNDAFVLMPGAEENPDEPRDLEKCLLLAYTAIHKQLDPEGKAKTIILYDEGGKGDWDAPYRQMEVMFNRGAFGDRPSKYLRKATTPEEVIEILKDARRDYRRVEVKPEERTPAPDLKDDTGKYNVCVFLSAGLEGVFEDKAEDLGYKIQEAGMGLVYGAADRNMMGGLLKGAIRYQEQTKTPMTVMGSSTRNIIVQETEKGAKPEAIPDRFFYMAPDITQRKEFLFKNAHAFVCLEGGVGTWDELLTYIWYKKNRPDIVQDKPMIISESAYSGNPIFKKTVEMYLGVKDYDNLDDAQRERYFEDKGILIMKPPQKLEDRKKLYETEMDEVMERLKVHREKYPALMARSSARAPSEQAAAGR